MKHNAMARGCRLDLSLAELGAILSMARRGAREGVKVEGELVEGLARALAAQDAKARQVRSDAADRRARKAERAGGFDRDRHDFRELDGFTATSTLGDYVDTSRLPDHHTWTPIDQAGDGVQGEIRRNVWCVHVHEATMYRDFVGHGTTPTSDRREIETTALRIIAQRN